MRSTILATAAALTVAFAPPALAQTMPQNSQAAMDAQQRAAYDSWPPERQRMYDTWQPGVQSYYWTLTPDQQTGWWILTDDQRNRIFAMTPQQRTQAWTSINAQLAGAGAMPVNNAPMASAGVSNSRINFVSSPVVQPIVGDQAVYDSSGKVPICGPNEYDNCMNAWEAGRRGPNVTEPLEYWPGEPADPRAGE